MSGMELHEVLAWALIAAGLVFGALASRGIPTAAVMAALAVVATKTALFDMM